MAQQRLASSRAADSACSTWPSATPPFRGVPTVTRRDPVSGQTCVERQSDVPIHVDARWLCPGAKDYRRILQALDPQRIAAVEVRKDRLAIGESPCPGWHRGVVHVQLTARP